MSCGIQLNERAVGVGSLPVCYTVLWLLPVITHFPTLVPASPREEMLPETYRLDFAILKQVTPKVFSIGPAI